MQKDYPFSTNNEWYTFWNRLPSNFKRPMLHGNGSPNDKPLLEFLSVLGIITSNQISELFSINPKRIKIMLAENKLVRHEIVVNEMKHVLYSLGENGALFIGMPVELFPSNYWVELSKDEVSKRLTFIDFYICFKKLIPSSTIVQAPIPFIAAIQMPNGNEISVYGLRNDGNDLTSALKWHFQKYQQKQMIILAERLEHMNLVKEFLLNMKVRVATYETIYSNVQNLYDFFYFYDENGQLQKEVQIN